jgi:hypothetical protein
VALITDQQARQAARTRRTRLQKSFATILTEDSATARTSFDIFLSHSSIDRELLVGLGELFQTLDISVYIDRVVDPHLSPTDVSRETARQLRLRMRQSKSLLYIHMKIRRSRSGCPGS